MTNQSIRKNVEMLNSPMWSILQIPQRVNDVARYEYIEYQDLNSGLNLQQKNQFDLTLSDLSSYVFPMDSWLQIDLNVVQATGPNIGDPFILNTPIAIVNSIMSIWSRIELLIDDQVIHSYIEPGMVQTIMSLSHWSASYERSSGALMGISHDVGDYQADLNSNEGFKIRALQIQGEQQASYMIPLGEIFSYFSMNPTVIRGSRIIIRLFVETQSSKIFYKAIGIEDGKIKLNKISVWYATAKPNTLMALKLEKLLVSRKTVIQDYISTTVQKSSTFVANSTTAHFSWNIVVGRPLWVWVVFVLDSDGDSQLDNSQSWFNIDVSQLSIELGSKIFPITPIRTTFSNGVDDSSARAYMHYIISRDNPHDTDFGSILSHSEWKDNFRMFFIPLINADNINDQTQSYNLKVIAELSPGSPGSFQIWIMVGSLVNTMIQGLQSKLNIQRA